MPNKVQCINCKNQVEINNAISSTLEDGTTEFLCPNCESILSDLTFLQLIETRTKIIQNGPRIDNPIDCLKFVEEITDCDSEKMMIFYVNSANKIICYSILSTGSVGDVIISPRHILKNACLCGAVGVILVHNHPSGNVAPSVVDRKIVDILNSAFSYFDSLRLLEFLIVAPNKYWSMNDENIKNEEELRNENQ
jgi:DNA repair protein RadC